MDDRISTKFSLWGGSNWGTNKEVIKEKKLVQDWYSDSDHQAWTSPSLVTFTLFRTKSGTSLELLHENIPDTDAKSIDSGWYDYYLGPLMEYLEKTGN